jgi:CheY-like chemotaxis protein
MATVLVIEDDNSNRIIFNKILTKRGKFKVKETEDVEEAITLAHSGEIDLIVMDVSLENSYYQGQKFDGLQITQMLKEDPLTAKIPIILVTAHAMQGDRENYLHESGADDYISKPIVDHQQFVDQVKAMINSDR